MAVKEIVFFGLEGNDAFHNATDLRSRIYGGLGNDELAGGTSDDVIFGGNGHVTDAVIGLSELNAVRNNFGTPVVNLEADGDLNHDGFVGLMDLNLVRNNFGEAVDAVFAEVSINDGSDAIHGDSGSDVIYGEAGVDSVLGADGNDLIFIGEGNDVVESGDSLVTVFDVRITQPSLEDNGRIMRVPANFISQPNELYEWLNRHLDEERGRIDETLATARDSLIVAIEIANAQIATANMAAAEAQGAAERSRKAANSKAAKRTSQLDKIQESVQVLAPHL